MKISNLSALTQNVDERKEDSLGRALPNSEVRRIVRHDALRRNTRILQKPSALLSLLGLASADLAVTGNYGLDWDIRNALVFSKHERSTGKRNAVTASVD
jgi:hypothetical protein